MTFTNIDDIIKLENRNGTPKGEQIMRYREYNGFLIKKNYIHNGYTICKCGKEAHHTNDRIHIGYKIIFNRLKDAKSFIDAGNFNNIIWA